VASVRFRQAELCSTRIRDQILTLEPTVVVSVGGRALAALRHIEDHKFQKMADAVASPRQWFNRWLFPVFHTGMLARNTRGGRPEALQRQDWRALRQFVESLHVRLPDS